jgi:hypothetical protein
VTRWRLALAGCLAWLTAACTDDTYVIGALCSAVGTCPAGGGAGGSGGTAAGAATGGSSGTGGSAMPPGSLELDLTGSGVERLPEQLLGEPPTHFFVADDATSNTWPARVGTGFDVVAAAALVLSEPSPFADPGDVLSHGGTVTFSADSTWADTRAGAMALELVFRAEPGALLLSQRNASGGVELGLDAQGRVGLRLSAGSQELVVSSQSLVLDAWHHCLAFVDAEQLSAQLFCNGQAGSSVTVAGGFSVRPPGLPVTLGGNTAARVHWAELARWQAATWGPRGAWSDVARERFARLVGTYAVGAHEPLPFAELRASGAYIDMSRGDAPERRRLHPVGEHWPRIVCRPTTDSARTCGLLVEGSSSRVGAVGALLLDQWAATELTVTAANDAGPSGASTLFALAPSATSATHTLQIDAAFADGPAVLSLFARAAGKRRLRAEVVGVASATFDLSSAQVIDATDTLVVSAEPWGEGLLRLSFAFDVDPGPGQLRLTLLDDDGATAFVGDGASAVSVGDVELRFRSFSTPLPMFGAIQQADHLVYPAGNGNLPGGPWFDFSAEIWLPAAPLLADAAIFNANFASRYDQQINLFVSPQDGSLQFWGKQGDATHWQFSSADVVTDGNVHQIGASVGPGGATLSVDGKTTTEPAGAYDLTTLDRVEVGMSTSSSGALTGIVRRLLLAPGQ